ncbi:uncharacterized protein [Panulirus ornatus]|uniref:uncharacterized protein isoform X2 n=1 Tax=Panulirus ornatus TaxID=150431 RepID=UPI003A8A8218
MATTRLLVRTLCRTALVLNLLWAAVGGAQGVVLEAPPTVAVGGGEGVLDVHLTPKEVQEAVREAVVLVREQIEVVEPHVFHNGGKLGPDSPAFHYYSLMSGTEETRTIAAVALISQTATHILAVRHNLTVGQVSLVLPQHDTMMTVLAESCPTPLPPSSCPPSRYRTLDGTCNNPDQPRWGAANTPYLRLLPAWYADGVSSPRASLAGRPLPPASRVSRAVHAGTIHAHAHVSLLAAVWTQYLAHDLSRPLVGQGVRGERLRCCGPVETHPECFPIRDHDQCSEYARTAPATTTDCALGVREQLNGATSFLDGSAIYGSSKRESDSLRLFETGHLKTQADWLLPRATSHTCKDAMMCFLGGDLRLNTHAGLAALQTLLVHEHNRIASILSELNPQWGDDTIFEEARAIVSAQIQHITYREFLPTLLGTQVVEKNELNPLAAGFHHGYDITIEPGVFNSVATVVLQLVLTLLPDLLPFGSDHLPLTMTALNMTILYKPGAYEQLIHGLVSSNSLTFDPAVSSSVRGYLGGLDLVARVVQSGRDHGLPPYVVWRPLCGRRPAHNFDDLVDAMNPEQIARLQSIYANVADIDLFTGIISERPLDGAVVGPTASCLLALQFKVLRQTDRYWYENDLPPAAFSKQQLFEIRKSSMARLVCNNVPGMDAVPRSVFLARDQFLNAPIPCSDLDDVNLGAWKTRGKVVVSEDILHSVVEKGKQAVEKRRQMEKLIFEKGLVAGSKSSVGSAYANNKPNPTSLILANTSVLLEATSQELVTIMHDRRVRRQIQGLGNEFDSLDLNLPSVDISGLVPPAPLIRTCRETEEHRACDARHPFRTISGHCNNLRRPDFGRSSTVFARMLPAGYDDGISEPRTRSVSGDSLPSPRTISTVIHNDISHLHARYTLMVMQFGQFLDHDITFTPVNKGFQNSILDCRDCEAQQRVHPECWPIPVPDNDPFYPAVNISSGRPFCIAFTRSLPGQQTLGPREQINQNTAFLDASHIYGQELCEARELRSNQNGHLNVTRHPIRGKPLLPQETGNPECKADSGRCFKAGDSRSSEQPGLAVVHTIWMREHNRIADGLSTVNPHWDVERLYQEARRIVTAEWQHIVYNEFLPRVLGWNAMQLYSLRLKQEGYYGEYDGNCNPGILNEFATAAFRFGHSLIRKSLLRMDTTFSENHDGVELRSTFFNPDMLLEFQMIDELVRGLISTPMETLDNFMTEEITNHLFEDATIPFSGLDLAALNIQRGREHGIRSYNEYRAVCNLKRARTFSDLSREIKPELIEKLQRVYNSVEDIDLFTGGLCETPLQGGIIGPTFGCIIGLQFSFLRKCDRFWYETSNPHLKFSEEQLADIRRVTMASLICENCDVVEQIQRGVFDMPHDFLNPRVPCGAVPNVNLQLWRDSNTCVIDNQAVGVGETRTPTPCTLCTCTPSGAQCQTLKVNCFELRSRFGLETILRDNVCRAQCGSILDPNRPSQQPPVQPPAPRPPPASVFSEGLTPPPPPPPQPQPQQQLPLRPRPPPPTGPIFRPPPPPPQNPLRFPFPIPPFLRSLFS